MSKENLANNYGLVLLGDVYGGCVFSYERPFCLHENVLFTHSRGGAFSYVNADLKEMRGGIMSDLEQRILS